MQMFYDFISLPSWQQITIWGAGGVLLGGLITPLVRSTTSAGFRAEHNDETGVIVAIVGVFYGLIVTSLLVQAIGHFDKAQSVVEDEANHAEAVVRLANATSPALGKVVSQRIRNYLEQVILVEWPKQRQGNSHGSSIQTLERLSIVVQEYTPGDDKQRANCALLLSELDQLHRARKERSFRIGAQISPELWGVSLAGEVLLVFFAMLMHIRSRWMHFLMASALSVSISMVFALILIFDTPFAGDISIDPEPYEVLWRHLVDAG